MNLATLQQGQSTILYDADSLCGTQGLHHLQPALFTSNYWYERALVTGEATGRGSSLFCQPVPGASIQWVLRAYRRGGLIAKLSHSRYLWTGLEHTRAFREMRLTASLFDHDLPVPRPVAACATRQGLTYQATLITQRIHGARTLADWLSDQRISKDTLNTALASVGRMIRRFHNHGLDHVDLNARNILLDQQGTPWLIDLDRCRLRRLGNWQEKNLERLERSIHKFDSTLSIHHLILQGYRS